MITKEEYKKLIKYKIPCLVPKEDLQNIPRWMNKGLIRNGIGLNNCTNTLVETVILTDYGQEVLNRERILNNGFLRFIHGLFHI